MNKAIFYSITATILIGCASFFFRMAMVRLKEPFIGAQIRLLVSFITCVVLFYIFKRGDYLSIFQQIDVRGAIYMGLGGIIMGCASILLMSAFEYGEVRLVSPITSTHVVVAVILSIIFLNERLTVTRLVGIIITLCGIILVS